MWSEQEILSQKRISSASIFFQPGTQNINSHSALVLSFYHVCFFPTGRSPFFLYCKYTQIHTYSQKPKWSLLELFTSLSLSWNNPYTLKCLVISIHWVVSNLILYCMEHVRENSAALGLKESNSHHCLFINLLNLVPL